jgi:hypothetical protein
MNAQSQLPQRMYVVMCIFCAFLNYLYIPRFDILIAVLVRIRRRVAWLVVPEGWKESAAFIFRVTTRHIPEDLNSYP